MRVIFLFLLLTGCAAAHERASQSAREAPIHARLHSRAEGDTLTLKLYVQQRLPRALPVAVTLELPDGVSLASEAPRTLRSRREARTFVLRGRPAHDATLYVRLDAETEGFGYHARLPYRFGRPEPLPAVPIREKTPLCVAARCFGASVRAP